MKAVFIYMSLLQYELAAVGTHWIIIAVSIRIAVPIIHMTFIYIFTFLLWKGFLDLIVFTAVPSSMHIPGQSICTVPGKTMRTRKTLIAGNCVQAPTVIAWGIFCTLWKNTIFILTSARNNHKEERCNKIIKWHVCCVSVMLK